MKKNKFVENRKELFIRIGRILTSVILVMLLYNINLRDRTKFPIETYMHQDKYLKAPFFTFNYFDSLHRNGVAVPLKYFFTPALIKSGQGTSNTVKVDSILLNKINAANLVIDSFEFRHCKFINVNFEASRFRESHFFYCEFIDSRLFATELNENWFFFCHFRNVNLRAANLDNAEFLSCNFENVIFEPETLPDIDRIATCNGLDNLKYEHSSEKLLELKVKLESKGYRSAAVDVETSILRNENEKADFLTFILRYVFLDLTYEYGSNASRPIKIYFFIIVLFSCIYWNINGIDQRSYIVVQPSDEHAQQPNFHNFKIKFPATNQSSIFTKEMKYLFISLTYSFSRSLRLGFGLFDFSKWVQMMQLRNFKYKETYFLKPISVVQSLISLYLIILWIKASFI
jgi:uncharacterized protein YjbI with pentapeptide repeats